MTIHILERDQSIGRPVEKVFAFFANAENLARITPPWLSFRIVSPTPIHMELGTRITYQIRWRLVRLRWLTEIVEWQSNRCFTDTQIEGPYSLWHHTHTFEPDAGGTLMRDTVRYQLPLGPVGAIAHHFRVRRDLETIFDYRAEQIRRLLEPDKLSPGQ